MRLIDADALIDEIDAWMKRISPEDNAVANAVFDTLQSVTEMMIDAEPMQHGRWMWEGRFKACSLCGSYIDTDDTLGMNHWKFCPYCGAKMDLNKEHENV